MKAKKLLDEFAKQTSVPMKNWETYREFVLLSDRKGQVAELERLAELAEEKGRIKMVAVERTVEEEVKKRLAFKESDFGKAMKIGSIQQTRIETAKQIFKELEDSVAIQADGAEDYYKIKAKFLQEKMQRLNNEV